MIPCKNCGKMVKRPYPTTQAGKGMSLKERGEWKEKELCNQCGGAAYTRIKHWKYKGADEK
jgi:hypothetical protein